MREAGGGASDLRVSLSIFKVTNCDLAMQDKKFPPQKVFFDGQVYDAFEQMKKFVRMAKTELIVIDPYFDDSVLPLIAQKHGEYAIVEMCKCASMKTANAA